MWITKLLLLKSNNSWLPLLDLCKTGQTWWHLGSDELNWLKGNDLSSQVRVTTSPVSESQELGAECPWKIWQRRILCLEFSWWFTEEKSTALKQLLYIYFFFYYFFITQHLQLYCSFISCQRFGMTCPVKIKNQKQLYWPSLKDTNKESGSSFTC